MSDSNFDQSIAVRVRAMQIIVGALIGGVLMFAFIAILSRSNPPANQDFMTIAAVLATVAALMARTIVVPQVVVFQRRQMAAENASTSHTGNRSEVDSSDSDRLLKLFLTKTVLAGAIVEGAAFFVLVSYLTGAPHWMLGIVGGLVAVMLSGFPTRNRVERWIQEPLELLELDRTAAGR